MTPENSSPAPESSSPSEIETPPSFGWNRYAELINGRFAMVGFVALILLELITHQDFFTWVGLR
jgi:hypothetical protein